jgi:hypothetical protein
MTILPLITFNYPQGIYSGQKNYSMGGTAGTVTKLYKVYLTIEIKLTALPTMLGLV